MLSSMCEMALDLPSVGFATLGDAGDKVSTRQGPRKLNFAEKKNRRARNTSAP